MTGLDDLGLIDDAEVSAPEEIIDASAHLGISVQAIVLFAQVTTVIIIGMIGIDLCFGMVIFLFILYMVIS